MEVPDTTCVVFTVAEKRLVAMDVATGPCVPVGGRKHALTSVHSQEGPERPEQMAAFYTVLTGEDATDALELIEERRPGRLYRCSGRFKAALVEADAELHRLADEDSDGFERRREELDRAWLATGVWYPGLASTQNRLFRSGTARTAAEKGQELYCWYGPSVPEYVVVSGTAARN